MLLLLDAMETVIGHELSYREVVSIAKEMGTGLGEVHMAFECETADAPIGVATAVSHLYHVPLDAIIDTGMEGYDDMQ